MRSNTPHNFTPAYDAYEASYVDPEKPRVSAFIGIQDRGGDASREADALSTLLARTDGPDVVEQGAQLHSPGVGTTIFMCYWRESSHFASWFGSREVADWLAGDHAVASEVGRWIEHAHIRPDHLDTLIADPTTFWGIAKLSAQVGLTPYHGYWGGTRDRILASENDKLDNADGHCLSAPRAAPAGYGEIVEVLMPGNAVVARGGPDWSKCTANEHEIFRTSVYPAFVAGCRYLSEEPEDAGCYAAYIVAETDEQGRAATRNHLISYFVQLSDVERWTRTHPTHIAIYDSFLRMVREIGHMPDLNLYHEVSVIPAGGLRAIYVNCAPETGLSRFGQRKNPH